MIRLILMRAERRMATNGDKGSQREDIFVPNTVDLPQLGGSSTQVSNCINQVGWQEGARKLHELDLRWVTCRLIKRELLFPIHLDHWWPNCMRHFPGDGGKRVIYCQAGIRWLKFCSTLALEQIPPSLKQHSRCWRWCMWLTMWQKCRVAINANQYFQGRQRKADLQFQREFRWNENHPTVTICNCIKSII